MSYTVSGTVQHLSKFLQQSSLPFGITFTGSPTRDFTKTFSSSDVNKIYFNRFTVTTTPTVIDVTSLTDAFGVSISFATVKHLQIVNNDATNNLTAGGGSDALFSALPTLVGQAGTTNSGSCVNLTTNFTVSVGAKNISLTASSGSISVDVLIVGN